MVSMCVNFVLNLFHFLKCASWPPYCFWETYFLMFLDKNQSSLLKCYCGILILWFTFLCKIFDYLRGIFIKILYKEFSQLVVYMSALCGVVYHVQTLIVDLKLINMKPSFGNLVSLKECSNLLIPIFYINKWYVHF